MRLVTPVFGMISDSERYRLLQDEVCYVRCKSGWIPSKQAVLYEAALIREENEKNAKTGFRDLVASGESWRARDAAIDPQYTDPDDRRTSVPFEIIKQAVQDVISFNTLCKSYSSPPVNRHGEDRAESREFFEKRSLAAQSYGWLMSDQVSSTIGLTYRECCDAMRISYREFRSLIFIRENTLCDVLIASMTELVEELEDAEAEFTML